MIQGIEKRRHRRSLTRWDALCIVDDVFIYGSVRDLSKHGLFFRPEFGFADGLLSQKECVAKIAIGDIVSVDVCIEPSAFPIVSTGVVRWSGTSDLLGCRGFGIQTTDPEFLPFDWRREEREQIGDRCGVYRHHHYAEKESVRHELH